MSNEHVNEVHAALISNWLNAGKNNADRAVAIPCDATGFYETFRLVLRRSSSDESLNNDLLAKARHVLGIERPD